MENLLHDLEFKFDIFPVTRNMEPRKTKDKFLPEYENNINIMGQ